MGAVFSVLRITCCDPHDALDGNSLYCNNLSASSSRNSFGPLIDLTDEYSNSGMLRLPGACSYEMRTFESINSLGSVPGRNHPPITLQPSSSGSSQTSRRALVSKNEWHRSSSSSSSSLERRRRPRHTRKQEEHELQLLRDVRPASLYDLRGDANHDCSTLEATPSSSRSHARVEQTTLRRRRAPGSLRKQSDDSGEGLAASVSTPGAARGETPGRGSSSRMSKGEGKEDDGFERENAGARRAEETAKTNGATKKTRMKKKTMDPGLNVVSLLKKTRGSVITSDDVMDARALENA